MHMHFMFAEVECFDQDLSGWDMSSVRIAIHMFEEARVFSVEHRPVVPPSLRLL